MKYRLLTFLTTLILLSVLVTPARLAAQKAGADIVVFDAPGADTTVGTGNGTFPESVNSVGAVTGHYTDSHAVNHGFVRTPDGAFTVFDAPDAGDAPGSSSGTFPNSINAAGTITGHYSDAHNVIHGFARSPTGMIATFDAPGAGATAGSGSGTFPHAINDAGVITGHYTDAHNVIHGFLRSPSGKLTAFDAPEAGRAAGSGTGTFPKSIQGGSTITGNYADAHNSSHGFLWPP